MPTSSDSAIKVLRRKKDEKVAELPVIVSASGDMTKEKIQSIPGFKLSKRIGNSKNHSNWQGTLKLAELENAYAFEGVHDIRWTWHGRKA